MPAAPTLNRCAALGVCAAALVLGLAPSLAAAAQPAWTVDRDVPQPDAYAAKSRVFVLTDMGNEPDDQMSFVRLLAYANEIDIEGMAATTSIHLTSQTNPQTLLTIIDEYAAVRPNLLQHAQGWPTAAELRGRVASGPRGYGMAAVRASQPSAAALALIAAADRADDRPLWVSIWGGANTLAEALSVVRSTRSAQAVDAFVARLRAYSISDQDDAGPWIRQNFPRLRYVVSPSLPDVLDYGSATWSGIAGDAFYLNGEGADGSTVTDAWLQANVRKGPLGGHYPHSIAIMEGDTPSYLGLVPNGLASAMSPSWGGWGGRYVWRRHPQAGGPIWTQGGFPVAGLDSRDEVTGVDGRRYRSDQATIWRWRTAFQHDFAARMDWTVKPFAEANHPPIPIVDGVGGLGPVEVVLRPGGTVVLDASASRDDDRGQALSYRWFAYPEAGSVFDRTPAQVSLTNEATPRVTISDRCGRPCPGSTIHVILEVTDNGAPALTRYRRVIVRIVS